MEKTFPFTLKSSLFVRSICQGICVKNMPLNHFGEEIYSFQHNWSSKKKVLYVSLLLQNKVLSCFSKCCMDGFLKADIRWGRESHHFPPQQVNDRSPCSSDSEMGCNDLVAKCTCRANFKWASDVWVY